MNDFNVQETLLALRPRIPPHSMILTLLDGLERRTMATGWRHLEQTRPSWP
jgi:hypothetical protein